MMGTLYIDRKDIEIRVDSAHLDIYRKQKYTGSVPLGQVGRIVTMVNAKLDTRVLTKLCEHKIGIAIINQRKPANSVIIPGYNQNDIRRRLGHYQAVNDLEFCSRWAHLLVLHKIKNQYRFVRYLLRKRRDKRYHLHKAANSLKHHLDELLDRRDTKIESLRGLEGASASIYFQAITNVFPPVLGFSGRNRRPPKDPVNACLSLGYTLMHFDAVLACQQSGLDPMLGIYHRPAFSRESLASDMIEPVRPVIDRWVWQLFRDKKLTSEHFYENKGACLLSKTGRKTFYSLYEEQAWRHRRILRYISRILVRVLDEER